MATPTTGTTKDDKKKEAEITCPHTELYWDVDNPDTPNMACAYCALCGEFQIGCNPADTAQHSSSLHGITFTIARPAFLRIVRGLNRAAMELRRATDSIRQLRFELGRARIELANARLAFAKTVEGTK